MSKGLDLLIPAAAKFATIYPEVVFKFVLPTRPEIFLKTIKKEIEFAGLKKENYVIFHELSRVELFNEICKSSCVVVPSYSEGFGFVAAEAVALGVPLISSQQGALPEEVSGSFLPMNGHSIDALVDALTYAKNEDWKEEDVKYFSLENTINEYLQLIDNQLIV